MPRFVVKLNATRPVFCEYYSTDDCDTEEEARKEALENVSATAWDDQLDVENIEIESVTETKEDAA